MEELQGLSSVGLPNKVVIEYFLEIVERKLRKEIGPNFWQLIDSNTSDPGELCSNILHSTEALYQTFLEFKPFIEYCERMQHDGEMELCLKQASITAMVQQRYKAIIFYLTPKHFDKNIKEFYTLAFKVFKNHEINEGEQFNS